MSKQFWGVIVVVILALVGIFVLSGNKSGSSGKSGGSSSSTSALTQHIEGQGKSGVTLVEYGDYECPFCGQYFPTVKQIEAEYDQQIHFQFRNFPLISIHQNAFASARAAEAAGLQGKFWEMNNLLYENQSQWSSASDAPPIFNQYAQQLGLNLAKFKSDYSSDKVNNLINADMAEGNKLNIQGTPTFFLDGKQIQVANSVPTFEKLINAEIAKKASGNSSAPAPTSAGTTSQTAAPAKQ
jgi:protein-disulfide isomerase